MLPMQRSSRLKLSMNPSRGGGDGPVYIIARPSGRAEKKMRLVELPVFEMASVPRGLALKRVAWSFLLGMKKKTE